MYPLNGWLNDSLQSVITKKDLLNFTRFLQILYKIAVLKYLIFLPKNLTYCKTIYFKKKKYSK